MGWKENPIMEWSEDGTNWTQITDHGRGELSVSVERIENKQRMANGRMRRYTVSKKRTFSCAWDNLPSTDPARIFLANGDTDGEWIEKFHNRVDGAFYMRLRAGSDRDNATLVRDGNEDAADNERIFRVMITDFSKGIIKRGKVFDLLSMDITLEEV